MFITWIRHRNVYNLDQARLEGAMCVIWPVSGTDTVSFMVSLSVATASHYHHSPNLQQPSKTVKMCRHTHTYTLTNILTYTLLAVNRRMGIIYRGIKTAKSDDGS